MRRSVDGEVVFDRPAQRAMCESPEKLLKPKVVERGLIMLISSSTTLRSAPIIRWCVSDRNYWPVVVVLVRCNGTRKQFFSAA